METYMKAILNDDTPDISIQYIGCNNIGNKQLTKENEIAECIVKIGWQCKENNNLTSMINKHTYYKIHINLPVLF